MADDPLRHLNEFAWREIRGGVRWEFADEAGHPLAQVCFEEDRGQWWSWYVTPPPSPQSRDGSGSPCGLARSAGAAKSICEAVLEGMAQQP